MELFRLLGRILIDNADADDSIDKTVGKAEAAGAALDRGFEKIGSAVVTVAKVGATATAALATGIGAVTKSAVESYANYEQLVGGVETLFNKTELSLEDYAKSVGKSVDDAWSEWADLTAGSRIIANNAQEAYKTAGLSANEYMETVTSFSASLISSLEGDTKKAAEVADRAMVDMADNANKMGTSMDSIQNAYQGFAKQNYTMLDNLKLGYGGTQEEMARLIADAAEMTSVQEKLGLTVDANSMSFANVVNAISVMQESMGIAGATAAEAEGTISGSIAMMSAAWKNLVTGMAAGDPENDVATLVDSFIESAISVVDNIVPRIAETLPRVVEGLSLLIQNLVPKIPEILAIILPALVSGATTLLSELMKVIPTSLEVLLPGIGGKLGQGIMKVIQSLIGVVQNLLPYVLQFAEDLLPVIIDLLPAIAEIIEAILPPFLEIVDQLLPVIVEFIQMLVPPLVEIIQNLLPVFVEILNMLMPIIVSLLPVLQPILNLIIDLLPPLLELINVILMPLIELFVVLIQQYLPLIEKKMSFIATFITTVFNVAVMSIKDIIENVRISFDAAWEGIKRVWEVASTFFTGIWEGIKAAFSAVTDWFSETFSTAWQAVKDVFSKGGEVFAGITDGIAETFKTVVNALITGINKVVAVPFEKINGMLNKIRSTSIAGVKPFNDLWEKNPLPVPEIPYLEEGGVLKKGQVGLLEGKGAEAVVPLERNTGWIDKISEKLQIGISSDELSKEILTKLDILIAVVQKLIGMQVVLDTGSLVGELAPAMDYELGIISGHKGRGN